MPDTAIVFTEGTAGTEELNTTMKPSEEVTSLESSAKDTSTAVTSTSSDTSTTGENSQDRSRPALDIVDEVKEELATSKDEDNNNDIKINEKTMLESSDSSELKNVKDTDKNEDIVLQIDTGEVLDIITETTNDSSSTKELEKQPVGEKTKDKTEVVEQSSKSKLLPTEKRTVWVYNILGSTKASDLKLHFSQHAKISTAKIVTNGRKYYGCLTLEDPDSMQVCIEQLNNTYIDGVQIVVMAKPPESSVNPRRSDGHSRRNTKSPLTRKVRSTRSRERTTSSGSTDLEYKKLVELRRLNEEVDRLQRRKDRIIAEEKEREQERRERDRMAELKRKVEEERAQRRMELELAKKKLEIDRQLFEKEKEAFGRLKKLEENERVVREKRKLEELEYERRKSAKLARFDSPCSKSSSTTTKYYEGGNRRYDDKEATEKRSQRYYQSSQNFDIKPLRSRVEEVIATGVGSNVGKIPPAPKISSEYGGKGTKRKSGSKENSSTRYYQQKYDSSSTTSTTKERYRPSNTTPTTDKYTKYVEKSSPSAITSIVTRKYGGQKDNNRAAVHQYHTVNSKLSVPSRATSGSGGDGVHSNAAWMSSSSYNSRGVGQQHQQLWTNNGPGQRGLTNTTSRYLGQQGYGHGHGRGGLQHHVGYGGNQEGDGGSSNNKGGGGSYGRSYPDRRY